MDQLRPRPPDVDAGVSLSGKRGFERTRRPGENHRVVTRVVRAPCR